MQNSGSRIPDEKELLQRSLKIIHFFVSRKGTQEFEDHKSATLNDLHNIIKFLSEKKSPALSKLNSTAVFAVLRQFLLDRDRLIRETVIKIFRLLVESPNEFALLKQKHIHIFLAKAWNVRLSRISLMKIFRYSSS